MLHGMLAIAALLAATLPASTLERSGAVAPLARGGALLLGAVALGLAIVPRPILAWVAPGTAAAFPHRGWSTLTLSATSTLEELSHLLLVVGMAIVVSIWSIARWRRRSIEGAVLIGAVAVAAVATLHAATGATALFGVFDTWVTPPDRFFAPFLNDNHLAASLLIPLPLLLGWSASDRVISVRIASGLLLLSFVGLIAWTGSAGALGIALLTVLATATYLGLLPRLVLGGAVAVALVVLIVGDGLVEHGRLPMWRAAAALAQQHWLTGSGGGTFRAAVEPYRSDRDFVSWDHAHNDPLEWGVEIGLLGLIAAGVALAGIVRGPWRAPQRVGLLGLGVVALCLHALIEFPLQIPALALAAAAILGTLSGVFRPVVRTHRRRLQIGLVSLAGLQLLAGAWQLRGVHEARDARAVLSRSPDADLAVERLERVAPWRPEIALHRAWSLEERARGPEAVEIAIALSQAHSDDPTVLRLAAQLLARQGQAEPALGVAQRAVRRSPADWRSQVALARVLEQQTPEQASEAWLAAIAQGAPPKLIAQGWRYLPIGLPWVQAVEGLPARYANATARELKRLGDLDAAVLAYESARLSSPRVVDPGHPRLLLELGRDDEADALLRRALSLRPGDPRFLRPLAELRERQGQHASASEAWLLLSQHDESAQSRAVRARAEAAGPDAALALVAKLELERGTAGLRPATRLEQARLLLEQGRGAVCVKELVRARLTEVARHRAAAEALLSECRAAR